MPRMPSRSIPRHVKEALRAELGFRCPAKTGPGDSCGSPYLTFHHFDPPWRDENHHRPEGMIALCREHADKADNGAYTDAQLREFKRQGVDRSTKVAGRFDWMRRQLLAVVGGNAYFEVPTIIEVEEKPAVWFERSAEGDLLLNFDMPTRSGSSRASMINNTWEVVPEEGASIICPSGGRSLQVAFADGDSLNVEFKSLSDRAALDACAHRAPGSEPSRIAAGQAAFLAPAA